MSQPPQSESAYANSIEVDSFRVMAQCSVDILCRVTADMRCVYASPSASRILGWAPEEMRALFPGKLLHPGDLLLVKSAHERYVIEQDAPLGFREARLRKQDGSFAWFEFHACLVRDSVSGAPPEVLLTMRDISLRVELERTLRVLAMTDALTGLANRRAFDEALEREWRRCWREQQPISLLLIDLDDFKGVNDYYGHQVGDKCLCMVGEALQSLVKRPGDLVARYGGEEMVVLLPATDDSGALSVAEQLRVAVETLQCAHRTNTAHGSVVTVSIGCATTLMRGGGKVAGSPTDLLEAADRSLFQAKAGGRNRVASSFVQPRRS